MTPGKGEAELWISEGGVELTLNGGRVGGRVAGCKPASRPKLLLMPSGSIVFCGRPGVQKLAPVEFGDDFARVEDDSDAAQWEVLSGLFEVNMSRNPGSSQSAFQLWASSPGGDGVSLARASRWFWKDLRCGVTFMSDSGAGRAGVIFNWRDSGDWNRVEVGGGRVRLLRCLGGRVTTLTECAAVLAPGAWTRLEAVSLDGRIAVILGGRRLLEAEDPHAVSGRIGLFLSGMEQAFFDDATAVEAKPADLSTTPTEPFGPCEQQWSDFSGKNFLTDPHMSQWAHPRSFWHKGADGMLWFRSRFFHDLAFVWRRLPRQKTESTLRIRLFSDETTPANGYLFVIDKNRATLSRNGVELAAKNVNAVKLSQLEARADDGRLSLALDGTTILEYTDPEPIRRGFLAADLGEVHGTSGRELHRPDWRDSALAQSSHRMDYSFEKAPAAWFPQAGRWQGTHRWACVPRWSFFGGRGTAGAPECLNANAILWNLRRIEGDFDLELFAAPMEGTPQRSHFTWPVAICVAFGADGSDVGSGYNCVFGTYDIPSRLFWRERELASNDSIVDTQLRPNEYAWYHHMTQTWQHFRIQRRDGKILADCSTHDNNAVYQGLKRMFEVPDEGRGAAGQFALWTSGENGVAIARATLSFQESPGAAPPPVRPAPSRTMKGGEGEPPSYVRHTNGISGGAFAAVLSENPVDVSTHPLLELVWRPGEGTSLSLMLKVREQLAEVPLTSRPGNRPYTLMLDGCARRQPTAWKGWESVQVDVAGALRAAFPDGAPLVIESVYIGSPFETIAEIAGLGVNRRNAQYDIASFKVTSDGRPQSSHTRWSPFYMNHAFLDDFEDGFGEWHRLGGPDGGALSLDWREPAAGKRSLRVLNQHVGGPAGATAISTPFMLDAFPEVTFSLRLPPGYEQNLIVETDSGICEIALTGGDPTWQLAGKAEGVNADNKWHRIFVRLRDNVRAAFPKAAVIQNLMVADSNRMSSYQRIAYFVDDFQLVPAIPDGATIELCSDNPDNPVTAFKMAIGQDAAVDAATEQSGATATLKGLPASGDIVHLRPRFKDGTIGLARQFRVLKAVTPPPVMPAPPPAASLPLQAPFVSYIPSDSLRRSDFDLNGALETAASFGDMSIRREAWLLRSEDNPATGDGCAEMVNLARQGFCSFYFRKAPWDPRRWPCVSFDYRFKQPGCNLNMTMLVNEALTVVEWTGPNGVNNYFWDSIIGRTPWAIQDNAWHNTSFNLLDMLTKSRYPKGIKGDIRASELATWATCHNGGGYVNPDNARLFIDNFTIFSNRGRNPAFQWRMPDSSASADAFSFVLDDKKDTMPPEKDMTTKYTTAFQDVKPGTWCFHLRARRNKEWGPAAHFSFSIDE